MNRLFHRHENTETLCSRRYFFLKVLSSGTGFMVSFLRNDYSFELFSFDKQMLHTIRNNILVDLSSFGENDSGSKLETKED